MVGAALTNQRHRGERAARGGSVTGSLVSWAPAAGRALEWPRTKRERAVATRSTVAGGELPVAVVGGGRALFRDNL